MAQAADVTSMISLKDRIIKSHKPSKDTSQLLSGYSLCRSHIGLTLSRVGQKLLLWADNFNPKTSTSCQAHLSIS